MDPAALYRALRAGEVLQALRPPPKPVPLGGHFTTVLQVALSRLKAGDPEISKHFAHVADEFVTLFDGFPKSRVHLLVMPREPIDSAWELTPDHLPMLLRMAAYTRWLLDELAAQRPALTWRQGVHAIPTLHQLHLHVLSQDFESPCLKHKKHYNSFQPPFLVPIQNIIGSLQAGVAPLGSISRTEAEAWLKEDLRCNACQKVFGNRFAELKRHLVTCTPRPSASPPFVDSEVGEDMVPKSTADAITQAVSTTTNSGEGRSSRGEAVEAQLAHLPEVTSLGTPAAIDPGQGAGSGWISMKGANKRPSPDVIDLSDDN